jgi:hypothetical protein
MTGGTIEGIGLGCQPDSKKPDSKNDPFIRAPKYLFRIVKSGH